MTNTDVVISLMSLPSGATFAEAMRWLKRMRRLVDRWDSLPGAEHRSMTPEAKQEVRAELDLLEDAIHRDMAMLVS
jgi:hypothetical protein